LIVILGTTSESFVINSNVLQASTWYKLVVIVTGYGREGYGESVMVFRTNLAPYDGHCGVDPPIGINRYITNNTQE